MPRCLECDRQVEAGIIFCPACGGEVTAPAEPTVEEGDGDPAGEILGEGAGASGATAGAGSSGRATGEHGETVADEAATDDAPPETDVEGPSPFERDPVSFLLDYPTRNGTTPLLYGFVAEGLGILLPPLRLLTWGYGFRLTRATARGQTEPPAVEDFGEVFVDGLRVFAVTAAFGLVALAAWGGAVALARYGGVPGTASVAGVVALLGLYLLPASLTAAAASGSLAAAASRERVLAFATSAPYAKAFLGWLLLLAVTIPMALVGLFTVVGGFAVSAWGTYASGALWGYYYRQAVARDVVPTPPDEPV